MRNHIYLSIFAYFGNLFYYCLMKLNNPIIIFLLLILSLSSRCSGRNEPMPAQKEDNITISGEKPGLNIYSGEDCLNFLKGKSFYGDKARIEFPGDGNAYIYSKQDNNPLFTGYVTVDQTLNSEGRLVRIHETFGSEQVIILLLKKDGNLTDLSDYTLFQPR